VCSGGSAAPPCESLHTPYSSRRICRSETDILSSISSRAVCSYVYQFLGGRHSPQRKLSTAPIMDVARGILERCSCCCWGCGKVDNSVIHNAGDGLWITCRVIHRVIHNWPVFNVRSAALSGGFRRVFHISTVIPRKSGAIGEKLSTIVHSVDNLWITVDNPPIYPQVSRRRKKSTSYPGVIPHLSTSYPQYCGQISPRLWITSAANVGARSVGSDLWGLKRGNCAWGDRQKRPVRIHFVDHGAVYPVPPKPAVTNHDLGAPCETMQGGRTMPFPPQVLSGGGVSGIVPLRAAAARGARDVLRNGARGRRSCCYAETGRADDRRGSKRCVRGRQSETKERRPVRRRPGGSE
jgi:hypothetical protein